MGTNAPLSPEELKDVIQGPIDTEWKYEMRRECQEILPGLFLGPFVASKSLEMLQSLGVTHIVCIRDQKEAFSVRPRFPDAIKYLVLDVQDNEEQNLIRLFPSAKTFIDEALSHPPSKVLVHCNGGISLSPAFVVMFVMQHYHISWEDALHMVQNRRYCISPNGGFLTQIKEYEAIYKATVAVSTNSTNSNTSTLTGMADSGRRKRVAEDDEGEEERGGNNSGREGEGAGVGMGWGGGGLRKRALVVEEDPDAMET